MNRKQFIQSRGATCRNWTWSWSFINHDDQLVIFGAWDVERDQERAVILREAWEYMVRKLNHRFKHFQAMSIVVVSAMMAGGCGFYVNKIRPSIGF
ncbi:TPA: hypothetical protein ACS61N_004571 [Klebsiella oxytoca]